jgi:hypothetical protein
MATLRCLIWRSGFAFYGGYDQITARAWEEWDRLYEVRQRMRKLSGREAK